MKQIRKMSNLVAEELQSVLESNGVTLDESVFESEVSDIVNSIDEACKKKANEACKRKTNEACKKKVNSSCAGGDCEDESLDEEVNVDEVYMVTDDITLGDLTVSAGDYVEIDELEDDGVVVTVYDADGEVTAEEVMVSYEDLTALEDASEPVEFDTEDDMGDEDEMDEAVHIKGGKKVKVSAAVEKLRAKLKAKKGDGVNKFTIKNGKIVKKSAEQLAADKKRSKVFAKKMKKFAKKRGKSLKKAAALNSASKCGTKKKVCEGFDITSGEMTFAVEEGDVISYNGSTISVERNGSTILNGLSVSESFIDNCISEGVFEEEETSDVNESASILSYKTNQGYVLVKEGTEIPMGNRIRARSSLISQGYDITSDMLDKAANGELVTL